jgi:hypothetical protein
MNYPTWDGAYARGRVLPKSLSKEARDCRARAERCGRRATAERDPQARLDFLDVERRWLKLARSYEFAERLDAFSKATRSRSR